MNLENVCFRQLNYHTKLIDVDLERIAILIFETDQYIYPDMFGTVDSAKRVLPLILRSGKDNMFNLENIYACVLNEEIVGLILWHSGGLNWTSAELRKVIEEENLDIPDTLSSVEKEYVSGYSNDTSKDTISIINLCVDQCYRNQGIGKEMLMSFLSEHPESQFELCVLNDNSAAIGLYSRCGFVKYDEEPAYPRTSGEKRSLMKRG